MIVTVEFFNIQVSVNRGRREVVFPYGKKWYCMSWDDVPEQYKVMYVAWLRFQGKKVEDDLKKYEKDVIDLSNLRVDLDLSFAREIPVDYPVGEMT